MKQFDLIYDPNEDEERYIFSNIDFDKLGSSVNVQREEPPQEEAYDFGKKKSEIVEYEAEEYKQLKDVEQFPLIVSDNESKAYSGKLNNISDNGNGYFAFINMGSYLKVIPIKKWYGFVQKNQSYEDNVDSLDKKLEIVHEPEDSGDSVPDIDYEDNFDDDDENDKVVRVWKEKKLNSYGKKIKGLMDNYEKEKKSNDKVEKEEEKITLTEESAKDEVRKKKVKISNKLTKEKLTKMIEGTKLTIKDLLKDVKQNYNLGEDEKKMIREFIYESCIFKIDSATGEKHFELKK